MRDDDEDAGAASGISNGGATGAKRLLDDNLPFACTILLRGFLLTVAFNGFDFTVVAHALIVFFGAMAGNAHLTP